jgi:hypothetical protein
VLIASLAWAVGGSLLAWIGKGGRTDSDGRTIASVIIGGAVLSIIVAVAALAIAHVGFHRGPLDANVLLLAAPLTCLAGSVAGIHWVFPLSELATVRTLRDVGLFAIACAAGVWLLSTFRGWGVMFLGGLGDLLIVGGLAAALLRGLYRRAFPQATPATHRTTGSQQ